MGHTSFIVAVCLTGPNLSLLLLSLPFYVTFSFLQKKSSLISHILTLDVVTLALAKRVRQKRASKEPKPQETVHVSSFILCLYHAMKKTMPMLAFWS